MRSGHKQIYATLSGPEVQVCFIPRKDNLMKEVVEKRLYTRQEEVEAGNPLSLEDRGSWRSTAVPQVMSSLSKSFHYNLDEKPLEHTSCLHGLACHKTGFIMHYFASVPRSYLQH